MCTLHIHMLPNVHHRKKSGYQAHPVKPEAYFFANGAKRGDNSTTLRWLAINKYKPRGLILRT